MTGNHHIKTGLRAVLATAVLAAAFALPAQAMAQTSCPNAGSDPTASQYCSVSGVNTGSGDGPSKVDSVSVSDVSSSGTTAVETSGSGSLPFTGLDVGILAAVAAALMGTGLLLRRLTASGVPRN